MAKDQNDDTLKEDMQTFISLLVPFLEQIHSISVSNSSFDQDVAFLWKLYFSVFLISFSNNAENFSLG